MIDRNTSWRQGSILKPEELISLDVQVDATTCVVVISHDCDIPQEKESYLELIVGKIVRKDKTFLSAKNVRRLHLKYASGEEELYVELCFQERILVDREKFARLTGPCESFILAEADKRILKQWLSVRYGRPAYPNAFETRLQRESSKRVTVEKAIGELVSKRSEHVTGLFFSLAGDRDIELEEGIPYNLTVYVVYDLENGAIDARKDAEALATEIETLLRRVYGEPDTAVEICVESCTALADTQITLADLMKIDQWRLEWVSLQSESPNFLAVGHA